ncbi:MAG: cupin domain-containing protein [Opitutaceae bacterium]|nr:cupin domain-containing protein [Opitutaceae bacterium]
MIVSKEQLFVEFNQVDWEYPGPGVRRKVMTYTDELMGVYVEFEKGAVGAIHTHPHLQFTYVRSGEFEVHIGEETKILREGDFYFIPSNVAHGVVAREAGALVDVFTPMREDFVRNLAAK